MERKHEEPAAPVPVIMQPSGMKPIHIVVFIVLIVQSFLLGALWTKVEVLKQGGSGTLAALPAAAGAQAAATPPPEPTVTVDQVKDAFSKSLIKFGNANSKLVLVEVADPSCPYCHVAGGMDGALNKQMGNQFTLVADGGSYVAPVPEMKKLVDQGKASFAYIYYPGHGNGEMGTKALYCAFEKGKFWEVHDKLMTNDGYNLLNNTVKNDKTKSGDLAQYLSSVFDEAAMKSCIDSGKYDSRLNDDMKLSDALGNQGTPGFYVNGTRFSGAYSYKDMESAVQASL